MHCVLKSAAALAAAATLAACADKQLPVSPLRPNASNRSQSAVGNAPGNWALSLADYGYLAAANTLTSKTEEFSVSGRLKVLNTAGGIFDFVYNVGGDGLSGWDIQFVSGANNTWHVGLLDVYNAVTIDMPQASFSGGDWHSVEVGRHGGRWFATIDGHTTDLGVSPAPAPITDLGGQTFVANGLDGWLDNIAINDLATHSTIESFPIEEGSGSSTRSSDGTTLTLASYAWVPTTSADQGGAGGDDPGHTINTCGTVIDQPGNYVVTRDLLGCTGDGIDIRASNVRLRLKGHVINSIGSLFQGDTHGIDVDDQGPNTIHDVTIVGPGEIREFKTGVTFIGAQNSSASFLTVDFGIFGFAVNGPSSHFTTNSLIAGNRIFNNFGHAITMNGGTQNVFSANDIENNNDGIYLYSGNMNTVIGNLVLNNWNQGISTDPDAGSRDVSQNLITGNRASGNFNGDAVDRWGNCTQNTWIGNKFGNASPGCIR